MQKLIIRSSEYSDFKQVKRNVVLFKTHVPRGT